MSPTGPVEWHPQEPVRLIAGTPPGGGQDRAARALASSIHASTGLDVAVSNLPGRGGGNAWESVASREGDPGIISISSPTLVTNALEDAGEPSVRSITHLALLCTEHIVFVVSADGRTASAGELVETLSTRAGSLVVAIATALRNVNHIAVSMVARHAGADPRGLDVRAFGSARTAVAAVVSGDASLAAVSAASALPEIEAGSLRAVAVSSPSPLDGALADVPTWTDFDVPCVIGTWRGVVAPPALPEAAIAFWDDRLASAVADPTWRAALEEHLWSDTYLASTAATRFVEEEERRLGRALAQMELGRG